MNAYPRAPLSTKRRAMFPQSIDPTLATALTARGYTTLTPVQTAVLEPHTTGRDLLVSARTGSGKTVAYGLLLAETLLTADKTLVPAGAPAALVIAPTRELAMQVQSELQWLFAGARVVSCVGGMDPRAERRALDHGCHIVVGTPGRLRDHLERGALRLSTLGAVVLDEADEMLDLGFKEELEEILDATPKSRRTLLFSATLPRAIVNMAAAYQTDALRLTVGAGDAAAGDIDYRAVRIAPSEVELATVNVLRFFDSSAAIVFCSTREAVRKLHANLVERGFSVVALSGELSQAERTYALQALRDRRARVCVATDVAARGIDIPDLDLVIHADLPANPDVLQHRSGRTGRRRVEQLLKSARIEATWQGAPTAEDIRARDEAKLIEDVTPAADASEQDVALAYTLMAQRSPEAIAAAYIRLARAQMPAPEDLADSEPEPRAYQPPSGVDQRDVPRPGFEDAVWFTIGLGRNKNAEARWILPMICRRGHVTKTDIGAIRIFERETRFQITAAAVEKFEGALTKGDSDGGKIQRLDEDAPPPQRDRGASSSSHRKSYGAWGEEGAPPPPPKKHFKPKFSAPGAPPPADKPAWRAESPDAPAAPWKKKTKFEPAGAPAADKPAWRPEAADGPPAAPWKKKKKFKPRKANG